MLPSRFEENLVQYDTPGQYVEANAMGKAEEVAKRMKVSALT